MAEFDLVIRNGAIADGTGGTLQESDVAIIGDRIAEIGRITGSGRQEIDAKGKIVAPGFIDVHTHYDGQVTWENRLAPSTNHGVTTVVMGNCGVGFAPVRPGDQEMVIKLMEGVEDIPEAVMTAGIPWNWESFPDYLDALSKREADADFAAQLPHSTLRVFVMGRRGAELEPPTQEDLAQMRRLTAQAVGAGAIGVSTSRSLAHRFRNGALAPSVPTEEQELLALAAGLRDAGAGVFQMIPNTAKPGGDEFALMERLVERSGRPLNFSLLDTPDRLENWRIYLDGMAQRDPALPPIHGQFYPRPIGILFGLDLSYHPFSLNPSFRPIAHLPLAEKVAAMRDPELRRRLLAEQPDDPNPFFVSVVKRNANLYILGNPPNYTQPPEASVAARAVASGRDPMEVIYDDLLLEDGRSILYAPSTRSIVNNLELVREALAAPTAVVGLGDGGAHYGLICDAAYPTFLLTEWVSGLNGHSISLEAAIHGLTQKPARSVGLLDRGVIARGMRADLNLIDPARLCLGAPRMETSLPQGGKRLIQDATGYAATILRGVVTYRDGAPTGAHPGRLLRGRQLAPLAA